MKLGHISFHVEKFNESVLFYSNTVEYLGLTMTKKTETQARFGSNNTTRVYFDKKAIATTPIHICFEVTSRQLVDDWYAKALQVGGTDNGLPGIRKDYSPTYYAAFVIDPNGHNIEVVCR